MTPGARASVPAGVLSKDELVGRLFNEDLRARLFVVPLFDKAQVSHGSIDLRLGTDFIVTKRTRYAGLDPLEGQEGTDTGTRLDRFRERLTDYQEHVHLKVGRKLTLHPQQFVLGSSLEYVRLPTDLAAYVVGRSSWGRMGLVIATATLVHPGYAGAVTLELANIGDAPIALYPGTRVAQLVVHNTGRQDDAPDILHSKYSGLTGPATTRVFEDADWDLLEHLD